MIFPAPVQRAAALYRRRVYSGAPLLLACAVSFSTSAFAARDELPRGKWVERQSGLLLEIKAKNTIVLFSESNSTGLEVVFTPEIFVRDEFWMSIQSIQEKPHESKIAVKQSEAKKPIEKQAEKSGEKSEPPPKAPEPLRLDWLAADHKMILSFLMQEPEPTQSPEKKKAATAETTKPASGGDDKSAKADSVAPETLGSQPTATKPLPPVPVLEVLIFKKGLLIRELIFDRAP